MDSYKSIRKQLCTSVYSIKSKKKGIKYRKVEKGRKSMYKHRNKN